MTKTILIVDDSLSVLRMVSFSLQGVGYEVLQAINGKEALLKLNNASVHLVIADLNMPQIDGIELIRAIRAHPTHRFVPIVMLTTESQAAKKQEGKAAGATAWIVKPFRPEQLVSVVKKVLG